MPERPQCGCQVGLLEEGIPQPLCHDWKGLSLTAIHPTQAPGEGPQKMILGSMQVYEITLQITAAKEIYDNAWGSFKGSGMEWKVDNRKRGEYVDKMWWPDSNKPFVHAAWKYLMKHSSWFLSDLKNSGFLEYKTFKPRVMSLK